MDRTIKSVQWNIGGGKVSKPSDGHATDVRYDVDGLEEIVALLKKLQPDIITLQEIHASGHENQAKIITQAVGLPYSVSDFYADSHIEAGQKLGQCIISRYPISQHDFQLFWNPHYEVIWEDGRKASSHDKGVTSCQLDVEGAKLTVKTLHLIPFGRFNVDPFTGGAEEVLLDVQNKLRSEAEQLLIQGDFNLDTQQLQDILPATISGDTQEILQNDITTPNGRRLDHIIYLGLELRDSETITTVATDHYPVVARFSI
ncbi:MAG: endonuclease/exonuclease/phosphatase family protein [Candidatus Saccharibacteria bacterium]